VACLDEFNMLFFRSFDNGLTWHDGTVADIDTGMAYHPTILYSQERLHLVYELNLSESRAGYKIYYSRSDDLGLSWSPRITLSSVEVGPPYNHSQFPSAYADGGGHIIATWFDYQYGSMCGTTGDILARVSTDNGETWLPESRLTYTQSGTASSCLILNDVIYVAWDDASPYGCDCRKIMLSSSSDWGLTWSQPEVITGNQPVVEQTPFLLYSLERNDTLLHCLYDVYDSSYGSDLYYIRNKSFYSDRILLPRDIPEVLKLRAYPNVFNSSTIISYENSGGDEAEVEIYNVLGQRIWSKSIGGKEGSIIWDAKDMNGKGVSSGMYFVRATTGKNVATAKILYLK